LSPGIGLLGFRRDKKRLEYFPNALKFFQAIPQKEKMYGIGNGK
jgi:hypothetical protein